MLCFTQKDESQSLIDKPFSCSAYSPMDSVEFSLVLTQIESGPCLYLIPWPPAAQFVRAVKNVGVEPKGLAERK